MRKTVEGFKTYRHASNPREEALHDEFVTRFDEVDLDRMVFGDDDIHPPIDRLNDRERKIVISTVQWFGSPMGQHFLRSLGYCDMEEFVPRENLFSQKLAHLETQLSRIPKWVRAIFRSK